MKANEQRGRGADGVGIGAETARSYLAEDVPSGSQRSVERWLKTLIGRNDVSRVWIKPLGSKETVWHHDGPLLEVPRLDALFDTGNGEEFDIAG